MTFQSELPFRVACVLFVVLGWAVRFVVLFQLRQPKPVVRSVHTCRERIAYWIVAAAFQLGLVYGFTPWMDGAHVPIPDAVRWPLGVLFNLAAFGLFVWIHRALGRNWSGILEVRENHQLVTDGPYRWVRHPMYSTFFLFCLAQFTLSANWLVGLISFLTMAFFYLQRVHDEEGMLLGQFGDAYRHYMKRTGRLLPRIL